MHNYNNYSTCIECGRCIARAAKLCIKVPSPHSPVHSARRFSRSELFSVVRMLFSCFHCFTFVLLLFLSTPFFCAGRNCSVSTPRSSALVATALFLHPVLLRWSQLLCFYTPFFCAGRNCSVSPPRSSALVLRWSQLLCSALFLFCWTGIDFALLLQVAFAGLSTVLVLCWSQLFCGSQLFFCAALFLLLDRY